MVGKIMGCGIAVFVAVAVDGIDAVCDCGVARLHPAKMLAISSAQR